MHSDVYSVVKVLRKETVFPHCRATDSRWNKKPVSLGSSVTADYYYLDDNNTEKQADRQTDRGRGRDTLTGISVSSQCLHHFLVGLTRLGASGSTISRMYFLF